MNWRAACRNAGMAMITAGGMFLAGGLADSAGWIDLPVIAAAPSPSPKASATPIAEPRGGPISISIVGNVVAGESLNGGTTGAQTGTVSDAGAVIDLSRRTPNTSTDVTLPASFSGHGAAVGQMSAEFDTPKSSYLYGPQQVGALGLVPAGTTARGPAWLIPRKHGDLTVYGGVVGGEPSYFVRGARLRTIGRRGISTLAFYQASSKEGGSVDGALLGLISAPARTSEEFEFGFEHHRNLGLSTSGDPIPDGSGFALEGRIDTGSQRSYATLNLRDISPNYQSLGGLSQSDRYAGLSYRSAIGSTPYTTTIEQDRTGGVGSVQNTDRQSFSLTQQLGRTGTALFSLTNQVAQLPGDTNWSGTGTFALSYATKAATLSLSGAASRATDQNSTPNSSTEYQAGISRSFGTLGFQLLGSYARTTAESGNNEAPTFSVGLSKNAGKTNVSLTTVYGRQFQTGSALAYIAPTLSVSRRLSNVFVATVNTALQFRHDPVQPSSDGHSLQFSFSLGAPFAIGNGIVTGRPNPRLPGTISGVVQTDVSAGLAGSRVISSLGAANIAVVLDNQRVVRTDVQGRFTFRFIPAGPHQITIDPASLPRGTQPSSPITSVQVQGGQLITLVLGIGSYGTIVGNIVGGDAAATAIQGVLVVLDGKTRAVSDQTGTFAFGGLLAGPHVVAIVPDTFPATFGISSDATSQKVNVASGESTRVKFVGAPLGSIAGRLTYAAGQDKAGAGVSNAYVVANPGDHASITDDDGNYLLDNLPPGKYTLAVDPETLPEGLTVTSDLQIEVNLESAGRVGGMNFQIGEGEKGVVFTFQGNETNVVTARAVTRRLPPGGSAEIHVKTSQPATKVTATAFGVASQLTYHAADKTWTGYARIPANAKSGPTSISIDAQGKAAGASYVEVVVDPSIPIVSFELNPRSPTRGQYVHVRAHFLVDAKPGDKIIWQDGTVTILPKPRSGRYFEFDVKVGAEPYRGALVTATGQLPLTLVK